MLGSWAEFIETVGSRPGIFVGRPKFSVVCALVQGFGAGRGDGFIEGFQQWISAQSQHEEVRNYVWGALVLREVFPPGSKGDLPNPSDHVIWTDWPQPPPRSPGEDDISYPEDHAVAVRHLFVRLREFLDSHPEFGSGVRPDFSRRN